MECPGIGQNIAWKEPAASRDDRLTPARNGQGLIEAVVAVQAGPLDKTLDVGEQQQYLAGGGQQSPASRGD